MVAKENQGQKQKRHDQKHNKEGTKSRGNSGRKDSKEKT
jgi:hypothetical protein